MSVDPAKKLKFPPIRKGFSLFCCESRTQLRGSQMYFTPISCEANVGFFLILACKKLRLFPPSVRDNSVLHLVKTHPFPPVLFSIFLPALRSSFKKWRQRFPRLRCFSPDEARGFILYIYFLISSFTLFHFSLPSSFHLINKHTLQPTFIEQLGSSVPSHFFF